MSPNLKVNNIFCNKTNVPTVFDFRLAKILLKMNFELGPPKPFFLPLYVAGRLQQVDHKPHGRGVVPVRVLPQFFDNLEPEFPGLDVILSSML